MTSNNQVSKYKLLGYKIVSDVNQRYHIVYREEDLLEAKQTIIMVTPGGRVIQIHNAGRPVKEIGFLANTPLACINAGEDKMVPDVPVLLDGILNIGVGSTAMYVVFGNEKSPIEFDTLESMGNKQYKNPVALNKTVVLHSRDLEREVHQKVLMYNDENDTWETKLNFFGSEQRGYYVRTLYSIFIVNESKESRCYSCNGRLLKTIKSGKSAKWLDKLKEDRNSITSIMGDDGIQYDLLTTDSDGEPMQTKELLLRNIMVGDYIHPFYLKHRTPDNSGEYKMGKVGRRLTINKDGIVIKEGSIY